MGVLSNIEPYGVFRFFEEICGIPHGSSDTKKISDYLVKFAIDKNLRYIQDESNNVIIFKDGTAGYEDSAPVMLQGHMDMVCEKDVDCDIDFERDGLRLVLEDGVISADGTTLGGDDGIAVAFALAILDADDIPHPPIECVFTVDEEIGMLGAAAIDCSPLKSRIMLNLDSEDEGYLLVSCATCHIPVEYENAEDDHSVVKIIVEGLTGGHSGVEIIKQRANADKQLARLLYNIGRDVPYRLISIKGGLKDNAIPNKAEAYVGIDPEDVDNFVKSAEKNEKILRHELGNTDPELVVKVETDLSDDLGSYNNADDVQNDMYGRTMINRVMTEKSSDIVIRSLMMMPNGIQKMSNDIEGLVQTSLNLGILKTTEDEVTASFSVRSSVQSEKENLIDQLRCVSVSAGGSLDVQGDYPAWEYRHDSPLRDIMVDVFEEQYGRKPVIQAIHAGVECGLFAGKLPGLDCVSFGPDMKNIHTSRESMDVASVQRTWKYTLGILEKLK